MSHGRKKKKKAKRTTVTPEDVCGDDFAAWSGDGVLKDTPFADLKNILRQYASGMTDGKQVSEKSAGKADVSRHVQESSPVSREDSGTQDNSVHKASCMPCNTDGATDEESLWFLQAMEGVVPLSGREKIFDPAFSMKRDDAALSCRCENEDTECTFELNAIINGKKEIPVEHTPEYIEGPGINSNPHIVRKLRRGRFSVQEYCDLHGLTAKEALEWCEEFMAGSIAANRSCIAFIHGRGLSSPHGPVLKKMVQDWLQTGKWKRHVTAFSSAPNWDGGPGVTYVLLRHKPKPRKKRPKRRLW